MRQEKGEDEKEDGALREDERGGKETWAWLLGKSHLAAWHDDAGSGLRGGARGIDLKTQGIRGQKDGGVAPEEKPTSLLGIATLAVAFAVALMEST